MNIQQARDLADALNAAADQAEAAGEDEITLLDHLLEADDAARADLVDAIQSAGKS